LSPTILRARTELSLPVEAEVISPDHLAGLSEAAICSLPLQLGRQRALLGDIFAVQGAGSIDLTLEGDLSHVKHVGKGMTRGSIAVHGNAGMHLGASMKGGVIDVWGNAGSWTGAEMAGGVIRIHGDAAAMLAAAYPGEGKGMAGGIILVDGSAGARVGERMRRGLIAIRGNCGEFAGNRMVAGTIVVFGHLGSRPGAEMKRGTILALGGLETAPLPTFHHCCDYSPDFVQLYLRSLREYGMPVTSVHLEGSFARYAGDTNTLGKGEILIYDQH
jgi:formylmethanofuran dehydrogenase subunit C